jgi:fluoroquinolone transport system permease protein
MRRLLSTTKYDITLQVRHGFYYATSFVLIVCVGIVSRLPSFDLKWLLPALVLGNLILNTFYYIGGLVLLEKGEGTLEAQVITPLRTWEYLASKIGTLTLLGLIENIIIVIMLVGFRFDLLLLSTSIVLTSMIYCLAGVVAVVRYDSINEYPSLLSAPLVPYLVRWESWPIYLHPLQATLLLSKAGFQPVAYWQEIYGVFYPCLWIGVLAYFGHRTFRRFIILEAGLK